MAPTPWPGGGGGGAPAAWGRGGGGSPRQKRALGVEDLRVLSIFGALSKTPCVFVWRLYPPHRAHCSHRRSLRHGWPPVHLRASIAATYRQCHRHCRKSSRCCSTRGCPSPRRCAPPPQPPLDWGAGSDSGRGEGVCAGTRWLGRGGACALIDPSPGCKQALAGASKEGAAGRRPRAGGAACAPAASSACTRRAVATLPSSRPSQ